MRRLGWKSWTENEDGNIGMIFAAMLIPTIMLIGGAVDYGDAINKKTLLQNAADAATLAAAKLDDDDTSAIIAMAEGVFAAKLEGTALEGVEPDVTFDDSAVTLTADGTSQTAFMKMANIDKLDFHVRSVASKGTDDVAADETATWGKLCLLALDPNASTGILAQGSKTIDLGTCWAYTNSESTTAVDDIGNSYVFDSGGVCAVGFADVDHDNFNPAPRSGCNKTIADPYATTGAYPSAAAWVPKTAMPTVPAACKSSGLTLKKGTYTLDPGRYCAGIKMQAQAKVTFNPGVYIIDDGSLQSSSGSQLTGTNVVFYLYNSNTANTTYPKLDIGSGSIVSLVGRHTGQSYQGFAVMQNAMHGQGQTSLIQGGGTFNMEGVLYLPTQKLEIGGNGAMNGSSNFFIGVVKSVELRGSGHLYVKARTASSLLPDITPEMPTLNSQTTRLIE